MSAARSCRALLLLSLVAAAPGCNQFFAERLVEPPNGLFQPRDAKDSPPTTDAKPVQALRIPVGPPNASLAVWVHAPPKGLPVRGTIFLLHGFLNNHHQLEGAATSLSKDGFRTVLVDLRGHGESTGDHISFGVRDAQDMVQLTTELQRRNLCGPTLGVYGTSYGASTAILFAAADPRVTAVVAVAPFASLREEAPHFGRVLMPIPGNFLSAADYTTILDAAGKIADFNPDDAAPVDAITRTKAPILLIHGNTDAIIPVDASRKLHEAAPDHSTLTIVSGGGHLGLSFDPFGTLRPAARAWFEKHLDAAQNVAARNAP